MGSDVKNIDGYRARGGEAPWIDPNKIVVVGLDVPASADNWFAHCPRIDEDIEEEFVQSVREDGVRKPVEVCRDGNCVVLLAGRRRVRAARIVWKEQADKDVPADSRIAVRVLVRSGSPADLFKYNVRDNADRKDLNPIQRATMMASHQKYAGEDVDKTAGMFNVSAATVRNYLSLLNLTSCVQAAVARRELSVANALVLTSLPRADQAAHLSEYKQQNKEVLCDGSNSRGRDKPPRRRISARKTAQGHVRPKAEIREAFAVAAETDGPIAKVTAATLAWVLNEEVRDAGVRRIMDKAQAEDEK
jgi:ParB/RepB/Spo0J family partition protein